jgi:hypothetical protein
MTAEKCEAGAPTAPAAADTSTREVITDAHHIALRKPRRSS